MGTVENQPVVHNACGISIEYTYVQINASTVSEIYHPVETHTGILSDIWLK